MSWSWKASTRHSAFGSTPGPHRRGFPAPSCCGCTAAGSSAVRWTCPKATRCAPRSRRQESPCVGVDYRLAPRFGAQRSRATASAVRFPLPLDDCERAWRWAENNAEELGIDARRMHVGGASAGGALAATLALRLLRGNARPPAGAVLAYPLLHSSLPSPGEGLRHSLRGFRRLGTFTSASVRWMARNYVGRDGTDRLPEAFPGGVDLEGFPPTLIVNSERDTLRASGEAFADELRAHGCPVEESFEPGTSHGHLNRPQKPEFHRSIKTISSWLSR